MRKTLLLILTLFLIGNVESKDIFVSGTKGNNKKDGLSWDKAVKTISYAIYKAEKGDVIHIEGGIYFISTPLRINQEVTLTGSYKLENKGDKFEAVRKLKNENEPWSFESPTVIWGETYTGKAINSLEKNTRLMESMSTEKANIVIDGITFTRGNGKSGGIDECGGALYSRTPGLKIQNCIFKENGVTKSDGKAGGHGGAVFFDESGTIENCYFYMNHANGGSSGGGAVYLRPKSGEVSVKNCAFEKNATTAGGAAMRTSGLNKVIVENCKFFNNIAKKAETPRGGAAIYLAGTFNPTVPSVSEVNNCLVYNNSGSSAVYISGGTIENTVISNNVGGVAITSTDVMLNNVTIWGNVNHSNGNTAGIYVKEASSTVKIENCSSDKKVPNYPIRLLGADNDDTKGPHFINPSTFKGATDKENAFENVDFSVKK